MATKPTQVTFADVNGAVLASSGGVPTAPAAVQGSTGNYATATASAAVVTKGAPGAGVSHVIDGIAWSYNATPGGSLTVTDDGVAVFSIDITTSGPGFFFWPRPLKITANKEMVVTLASGGFGIVGKVNLLGARTE